VGKESRGVEVRGDLHNVMGSGKSCEGRGLAEVQRDPHQLLGDACRASNRELRPRESERGSGGRGKGERREKEGEQGSVSEGA